MGAQFYFDEVLPSGTGKLRHKVELYTHDNKIHLRIWSTDDDTEENAKPYDVEISKTKALQLTDGLERAMSYLRWL